ncbi:replication initiation protein [Moraxella catarrhalis]|jgi:hypothetical protein|uniref:replication initiation protein n=1 Tax=Moraxella catarrhalis TaxID=480 RepID=UPI00128E1AD5|nr:replication initiation protein [Moraxella catarrhalis]MPY09006.1 RepB family plasmid replication initiator protein [Moraxella catarrhalis]
MEKIDKSKEVKTSQSLVHVKHSISILQYKYWFLFLKTYKDKFEIGEDFLDAKGFYFVSIAELVQWLGYEPKKKDLKQDLLELRNKPIVFNYLEKDGKPVTHGMGFISEWKVKGSRVGIKLPSLIIDVLEGNSAAKELFMMLNWDIFNSFTGKYEAIIYKLCRDYIGCGRTPMFTVEDWRQYIGLSADEYQRFAELNRCTISKPIANINASELSDILVDVYFDKKGKKVVGFYFATKFKNGQTLTLETVTNDINKPATVIAQEQEVQNEPKQKPKVKAEDLAIINHPVFAELSIKLSIRKLRIYLDRYSENQIKSIIERANEYLAQAAEQGKNIENVAGVYYKALDEAWDVDRIDKRHEEEEKKAAEKKAKEEARKAKLKADLAEAEKKAKEKAEQDKVILLFESLDDSEQIAILDKILASVPKNEKAFYKPKNADEYYYRFAPMIYKLVAEIKETHTDFF